MQNVREQFEELQIGLSFPLRLALRCVNKGNLGSRTI